VQPLANQPVLRQAMSSQSARMKSEALARNEAPSIEPDFTRWSRANLEKLVTDLNNQNLQLKADLQLALDAYRATLTEVQHVLTPGLPSTSSTS